MIFLNVITFIIISVISLYITNIISQKFNLFDYPDKKKIHLVKTPNIGGLAIIAPIILSFSIYNYSNEILMIFSLSIVVILIGFVDDLINFRAVTKLSLIAIPVIIFVYNISDVQSLGSFLIYDLTLGNFGFIFAFMCMLLLINATNYMDGIDGLISLLAIISFFGMISLIPKNDWNSLIPILCFLSVFLFFNLGIFPKQFLGDSGSLGVGFLLSSFSIYYTQVFDYINPAIIIWFLAFYVFEFLTINIIRIKNKQSVFKKDLNFIFNILEKKVGKLNTLLFCCILKIFFLINGYSFNFFELHDFSILVFIIYFFIYLSIRIKYNIKEL